MGKPKSKPPADTRLYFPLIAISDAHLGKQVPLGHHTPKPKLLFDFLSHVKCERLVLLGDMFEGWHLEKNWKFREMEKRCLDRINYMAAREGTELLMFYGNHDGALSDDIRGAGAQGKHLHFRGGGQKISIHLRERAVLDVPDNKRFLFLHGQQFDPLSIREGGSDFRRARIMEPFYNAFVHTDTMMKASKLFGFSLSNALRKAVQAHSGIKDIFEQAVSAHTVRKDIDGLVMGHLHDPTVRQMKNGFYYLNCGDWVENNTALVFPEHGKPQLLDWVSKRAELGLGRLQNKKDDNPYAEMRAVTREQLQWAYSHWPGRAKGKWAKDPDIGFDLNVA